MSIVRYTGSVQRVHGKQYGCTPCYTGNAAGLDLSVVRLSLP